MFKWYIKFKWGPPKRSGRNKNNENPIQWFFFQTFRIRLYFEKLVLKNLWFFFYLLILFEIGSIPVLNLNSEMKIWFTPPDRHQFQNISFLISISKSSGLEWMDLGFLAFILKRPEGRVPFAQWSYNFLCKEGLPLREN